MLASLARLTESLFPLCVPCLSLFFLCLCPAVCQLAAFPLCLPSHFFKTTTTKTIFIHKGLKERGGAAPELTFLPFAQHLGRNSYVKSRPSIGSASGYVT